MAFWIRDASLVIGHNKYTLDGLDFSFEIPFEDSDEPPVATVKVTNLSPNTRANIKKNDPVVLNAGYVGDVGCILVGKVVGLKHKQSNVDWTTTMTIQPCADEILGSLINKTYSENIRASAIVRDLLNIFGVEVAKCELSNDITYPRGRVCRGVLKQVLTEIVVSECKSRFIIRATGQIYITKADDNIDNGLLLTPANGLLNADEEKIAIPFETAANTQTTGEDRDEDLISRSCLLQYRIATAEVIKIQSKELNGKFVVVKGTHTGSRSGDWKTSMELKPISMSTGTGASSGGVSSSGSSGGNGSGGSDGSYEIGDVVNFIGTRHYVSSTGDTGYSCTPGEAKITLLALGAAHPYHLVHTNNSNSTVYGWVNAGDIKD